MTLYRFAAICCVGSVFTRRDHHDHLAAFQLRILLDGPVFLEICLDTLEQLQSELLVGHFAAPESQSDLGLVSAGQKPNQIPELDLVVTLLCAGPELNFLDVDLLLLAARRLCLLVLLEHELTVVHDAADWRLGIRRNLDQIQTQFCSAGNGFVDGEYSYLLTVGADDSNARCRDLIVSPYTFTLDDSAPLNL